jgi:UDP-glucose 4-epimerase
VSKCLVTGGAGFIGSHVVDALLEAGHEVVVVDNLSTGKQENLRAEAETHISDIRVMSKDRLLPAVEYVFHLAALARIQPSIDKPLEAHSVNLTGTLEVLEYCRRVGAKIIFSGSSSIYESAEGWTDEYAPKDPKSPYSLQKWMAEEYIELYGRLYGLDYTILRYFNVFGERQILDGAYAAVVGIFLDQRAKGQPLTITGTGEQRRDFTYVKDVAQANVQAMGWERRPYNIGTGKNYSINEIAEFVGGPVKHIPGRQGEVMATLANTGAANAAGWEPNTDIQEWINAA